MFQTNFGLGTQPRATQPQYGMGTQQRPMMGMQPQYGMSQPGMQQNPVQLAQRTQAQNSAPNPVAPNVPAYGGGAGSNAFAAFGATGGMNPYLEQMGNDMAASMTRNFTDNVMPALGRSAMAAGGYGGSRQGIAEGKAAQGLANSISEGLTSLYGQAYDSDRNRALQAASMQSGNELQGQSLANQYSLGLGNLGLGYQQSANNFGLGMGQLGLGDKQANNQFGLGMGQLGLGYGNLALGNKQADQGYDINLRNNDLGFANLDRQINNDNLGWQMQGMNFGLNAMDRMNAWNSGIYGVGNTIQQQPFDYWKAMTDTANSIGGQFANQTQSMSGSPLTGALGGAALGNAFANAWRTPPINDGGYSVGQGSAYGGTIMDGIFTPNRRGM